MKAYAIKNPNGKISLRTIRSHKNDCLDNYENHLSIDPWIVRYRQGYRCVPVEIREINKEKV